MSKHTPEPWEHDGELNKDYDIDIWSKNSAVNICEMSKTDGSQLTNANRIVSCVNAMQGIDDPEEFMRDLRKIVHRIDKITLGKAELGFADTSLVRAYVVTLFH
jgi:hypothetical protein